MSPTSVLAFPPLLSPMKSWVLFSDELTEEEKFTPGTCMAQYISTLKGTVAVLKSHRGLALKDSSERKLFQGAEQ